MRGQRTEEVSDVRKPPLNCSNRPATGGIRTRRAFRVAAYHSPPTSRLSLLARRESLRAKSLLGEALPVRPLLASFHWLQSACCSNQTALRWLGASCHGWRRHVTGGGVMSRVEVVMSVLLCARARRL
jgi:hypothetical protein